MNRTHKSWLAFSCALVALLHTTEALAVHLPASSPVSVCDPQDKELCAVPLVAGQLAPFAGQLLTPKLALQLGQKAESFDLRLKIETDYIKRDAQLDIDLEKQLRLIEKTTHEAEKSNLEKRLEQALQPPPIHERPVFVATVTAAATIAVAIAVLAIAVKVIEVRK